MWHVDGVCEGVCDGSVLEFRRVQGVFSRLVVDGKLLGSVGGGVTLDLGQFNLGQPGFLRLKPSGQFELGQSGFLRLKPSGQFELGQFEFGQFDLRQFTKIFRTTWANST